jgi:hypothetical protein
MNITIVHCYYHKTYHIVSIAVDCRLPDLHPINLFLNKNFFSFSLDIYFVETFTVPVHGNGWILLSWQKAVTQIEISSQQMVSPYKS